jgi:hypothetical protein
MCDVWDVTRHRAEKPATRIERLRLLLRRDLEQESRSLRGSRLLYERDTRVRRSAGAAQRRTQPESRRCTNRAVTLEVRASSRLGL